MTDDSDHDLETDPESWASPDPSESPETIVDPDELEIAEREDGRYVVNTDGTVIDPDVPDRHAIVLAVRDGEETTTLRVESGERAGALDATLRAYARTIDADRPPAETLRAVLAETTLDLTE